MEDEDDYPPPPPDADLIRRESAAAIKRLGGTFPANLPYIEYFEPRTQSEAFDRMLAMYGMWHIPNGTPVADIQKWVSKNGVAHALSRREQRILSHSGSEPEKKDLISLSWYIEALWAFAWAGSMIPNLPIEAPVGDRFHALIESVGKSGSGLESAFHLRDRREIYCSLDLYYLAHWYARDGRLNKYETGPFEAGIIIERRKTLEWLNNRTINDWDEISLDT